MGAKREAFVADVTPRSEDFSRLYTDIVRRAELADYSPVKGCMVIRPYGYAIWELMQNLTLLLPSLFSTQYPMPVATNPFQ